MITLPPEWRISGEDFKDEVWYWPIRCLKAIARYPHLCNTWVWQGHTVSLSETDDPLAANTKLCAIALLPPVNVPDEFRTLTVGEKCISFFSIVPLYREERDHAMKHGSDKLVARFDKHGVTELIDPARKNVCRRKWGLFG